MKKINIILLCFAIFLISLTCWKGKSVFAFDESVNIATGCITTSSNPFTNANYLCDGNKEYQYYSDSTPNSGLQWLQVDLGVANNLGKIKLWHYFGDSRTYKDIIIQLSNDPYFKTEVTTVFNNDTDNSIGFGTGTNREYIETSAGKTISFQSINARYVRFYSCGNTINEYNHYVEIEIFEGNTSGSFPASPLNLAESRLPTTSCSFSNLLSISDSQIDTESYADSTLSTGLQWIQIDLEKSHDIDTIKLWHYFGDSRQYHDVIIQLSNDEFFNSGITTVYNNDADNSVGMGTGLDSEYVETESGKCISFESVNARYVRFYSNGNNVNNYNHYVEIEIYDNETTIPSPKAVTLKNLVEGTDFTSSCSFLDPSYLRDGNKSTYFYMDSTPNTGLQWIQIDLGTSFNINNILLWHFYADARQYHDIIIQACNDTSFDTAVTTLFNNDIDNSAGFGFGSDDEYTELETGKEITFPMVRARYVRFYSNGSTVNAYNHYVEVELYDGITEVDLAEPTVTPVSPEPSESPLPSDTPEPSESPLPSDSPEPSESPLPSDTPEPSESPLPSDTPEPSESPAPSVSPEPTSSPEDSLIPLEHAESFLDLDSYDGSDMVTHPSVEYFPDEWNGHKYWMVLTPYTGVSDEMENPCIYVSEDGNHWSTPNGLENPIAPRPEVGHNCDTDMIYNNETDELWVYYVESDDYSGSKVNILKSSDGVQWSEPEVVISDYRSKYSTLSPTVNYVPMLNKYYMWSVNTGDDGWMSRSNTIELRESFDGMNWSEPEELSFSLDGCQPWHVFVKYIPSKNEYWCLYAAYPTGSNSTYTRLYYAKSSDGIEWTTYIAPALNRGESGTWDDMQIYRSCFIYDSENDRLRVWYSGIQDDGYVWKIGYTENTYTEFFDLLQY